LVVGYIENNEESDIEEDVDGDGGKIIPISN